LEEEYKIDPKRVVSIHHHFSQDDLDTALLNQIQAHRPKLKNKIKLGFLGVIFKPPRVPGKRVLKAVEHVRNNGTNLELHLFGDAKENLKKNAAENSVEGVIAHGRFHHNESLARVSKCDFLLLVLSDLPNSRAVMSIKLPHYLMLGKPIIAIVPDKSAVADIIRDTNSGYIIAADSDNWGAELDKTLKSIVSGQALLHRNVNAINAFSWENISREWLKALSA
jgi:glycosyltransferase involved in cell wall biosynthesis